MNLILMGMRGSGKSTVGALAARRLDRPFVDLDDLVLDAFPEETITGVWESHGETAWREAECRGLEQLLQSDHQVIALGGGTPCLPPAQTLLRAGRERGDLALVYLRCRPESLATRLEEHAGDRPSLTGLPPVEELADVLAAREATYREMASIVVDADDADPLQLAAEIAKRLAVE